MWSKILLESLSKRNIENVDESYIKNICRDIIVTYLEFRNIDISNK